MNKKYIMLGVLALFAISMVAATLAYYGVFSTTFTVVSAIGISGDTSFTISEDIYSGEEIIGTPITITNNAPSERIISITDDSNEDVDVFYTSELELTKKIVNFSTDVWDIPEDASKVNVNYVVYGDIFLATVENPIDNYTLVYYPDNNDRFVNPSEAWPIGVWELDNLPMEWDWNSGNYEGDYDYCLTSEYDTCHGAKLWYIQESALTFNEETNAYTIDWSKANDFYFESKLIQYNSEGNIILYGNSEITITPVYIMSDFASGEYTITTTVA